VQWRCATLSSGLVFPDVTAHLPLRTPLNVCLQVSVVQPVSGCGMAVMAVFSHLYLKEPMSSKDWVGVALAAAGTLGKANL